MNSCISYRLCPDSLAIVIAIIIYHAVYYLYTRCFRQSKYMGFYEGYKVFYGAYKAFYTIYNKKIFFRRSFFLYSQRHYMRAWICVLDVPGCYERATQAERKSALQGSGLVRIVGPCAQRRMPQAIVKARDTLSNDRRESAVCFERPAEQTLALATEP